MASSLVQIGKPGKSEGSNSPTQLGRPAHMELDAAANELYVADGYGNRRIGAFGRPGRQAGDFHWVHNIAIDSHGSVYTSEVDTGKRAAFCAGTVAHAQALTVSTQHLQNPWWERISAHTSATNRYYQSSTRHVQTY